MRRNAWHEVPIADYEAHMLLPSVGQASASITMSQTIRKAVPDDAAALVQLAGDCIAAMRAAGIEQWDEVYPDAAVISRDIEAGALDVMCGDDGIVACITV